jgi:hypothetical protein
LFPQLVTLINIKNQKPTCHLASATYFTRCFGVQWLLRPKRLINLIIIPNERTTENNVHYQFFQASRDTFINVNIILVILRNLMYHLKLIFLHTIKLQV